jgi:hypothetical protein
VPRKLIDLSDLVFGRLRVVGRGVNNANGQARWRCACECGTYKDILSTDLRTGNVKSCGCLYRSGQSFRGQPIKNEFGNRYGLLKVVGDTPRLRFGKTQWLCRCKCGGEKYVNGGDLRRGWRKDCGCRLAYSKLRKGDSSGGLKVVKLIPAKKDHPPEILCLCACGGYIVLPRQRFKYRKSCGCMRYLRYPPIPDNPPSIWHFRVEKYFHMTRRFEVNPEVYNIAIDMLFRCCWITVWLDSVGDSKPDEKAYIRKSLRYSWLIYFKRKRIGGNGFVYNKQAKKKVVVSATTNVNVVKTRIVDIRESIPAEKLNKPTPRPRALTPKKLKFKRR